MPACANCAHPGPEHDWKTPSCSLKMTKPPQFGQHFCDVAHPRRIRGRCLTAGCTCKKYVPATQHRERQSLRDRAQQEYKDELRKR
jgi:hypothetical protein